METQLCVHGTARELLVLLGILCSPGTICTSSEILLRASSYNPIQTLLYGHHSPTETHSLTYLEEVQNVDDSLYTDRRS